MTAAALHTQEQQEQKMLAVRTIADRFIAQAKRIAETPAPLTSADRCLLGHTAELLAQALDDAYTCGVNITPPAESNVRFIHTDTTRAINAALRARNKLPQRPAAPIVGVPFTTGPDAA